MIGMMNPQHGNIWLTRRHCLTVAGIAVLSFSRSHAAPPPPRIPGSLALNGFDSVSYFLAEGGDPAPGRPHLELDWGGRVWRFASAANREAFRQNPEIYAPRLGGFDPLGVVEGRLVDADPLVFALLPGDAGERRLYLFRNAGNREAAAVRQTLVMEAEARWPALRPLMDPGPLERPASGQR
jgi:hypothetical protein